MKNPPKIRKRLSDRVFALLQRHQRIDDQLRQERQRLWADPQRISALKKLKLAIKDRIARMTLRAGPPSSMA